MDHALDYDARGITVLRLYWGYSVCIYIVTVSALSSSVNSESIGAHFLAEHTQLDITIEHCIGCLIDSSDDILTLW